MEIVQEFFTRDQIAKMLGVHRQTLYVWEHEGKLKGYKLGRAVRYRMEDVQAMLDSMRKRP